MTERMLITQIVRTDANRADLYARGHRHKDLTLFTLSDLAEVGIDYASLEIGVETPCRFWAHYQLSDKRNQAGQPYKDVVALEAIDSPVPAATVDNSAILQELRVIRVLLQQHLATRPAPVRGHDDGNLSEVDAQRAFHALSGPAVSRGRIKAQEVNDLVCDAIRHGWLQALAKLRAELAV